MAEETYTIVLRAKDEAARVLRQVGQAGAAAGLEGERAFQRQERAADRLTSRLGRIAAGYLSIRGAIHLVRRAASAGGGLLEESAEFEERLSKFSVVFGQFAESTADDLDALADKVGRSRSELLGYASTFQDTFVPLGIAREEAAKLSVQLTELTADLASFNDKADADVARDLQSALVGQTETVRKYGIVLLEADAKQEAYRLGLAKVGEELTQQQKVQARLSLILKGSQDALGDAERTADSFRNQQKRLAAETQDLAVVFGDELRTAILRDLEEFGGMQRLLGLVKLGMAGVTGVTKAASDTFFDVADGVASAVEQFGDLDVLAAALSGRMNYGAVATTLWDESLEHLGRTGGVVFSALEQSAVLFVRRTTDRIRDLANDALNPFSDTAEEREIKVKINLDEAIEETRRRVEALNRQVQFGRRRGEPELAEFAKQERRVELERLQALQRQREEIERLGVEGAESAAAFRDIWGEAFEDIAQSGNEARHQIREALKAAADVPEGGFDLSLVDRIRAFREELAGIRSDAERGGGIVGFDDEQVAAFYNAQEAGIRAVLDIQSQIEGGRAREVFLIDQAIEKQRAELELARQKGELSEEETRALIEQGGLLDQLREKQIEGLGKTKDGIDEVTRALDQAGDTLRSQLADGFADLLLEGGKFKDLLREIGKDLVRLGVRASFNALLPFEGGGVIPGGIGRAVSVPGIGIGRGLGRGLAAATGRSYGEAAGGGIFGSPHIALIGERRDGRDEAVVAMENGAIPVTFRGRGGMGGVTYQTNYYIDAIDTKSFQDALVRERKTVSQIHLQDLKGSSRTRQAVRGVRRG